MKSFKITNGTVVLPGGALQDGGVEVSGGRIVSVGTFMKRGDFDAGGGYILPGFIDIHLHGGGGSDFMDGTPEAMRAAAAAHLRHGTTAMTPTTVACGNGELRDFFQAYREVLKEGTGSAEFLGVHLEGPYFSQGSKGAQPSGSLRTPTPEETEEILTYGEGLIVRWDAAPELDQMEAFARRVKERGILLSAAHTNATAEETARAFGWGFSHMTHFYNAMTTFRKIGQRVYAGAVEAAYLDDGVTIELIGDGCHIPRESMLLAYKIKGADRIALITDAMRAAGTDASESVLGGLRGGTRVIVEDGVAKLPDRSFFAGSVSTMDRVLKVAHAGYGVPLPEAVRSLSLTPARLTGADSRKGSLEAGKDADIVVMDTDFRVKKVFAGGRLLHEA